MTSESAGQTTMELEYLGSNLSDIVLPETPCNGIVSFQWQTTEQAWYAFISKCTWDVLTSDLSNSESLRKKEAASFEDSQPYMWVFQGAHSKMKFKR